jgi:hypothetical protein
MRTLLIGAITLGWIQGQLTTVRADDTMARAILAKAVAAHGGKKLATAKGLRYKWTSSVGEDDSKVVTTSERWVEFPDRVLGVSETTIGKVRRDASSGHDGKVAWLKAGGKVKKLNADAAKSLRATIFPDRVLSLLITQERDIKLSLVGEAKVLDRPAVGVRLERKNATDVNLYFDKKSGLMVKAEWRGKDPEVTEVTEERFFAEYKKSKESAGVKYPSRVTVHQDGKLVRKQELTEYELYEEGFGARHFAKPEE